MLPDHSRLSRLRERSGRDVCRRCVAAIVEQGVAAGLGWGQDIDIDATTVAANAALDSLHPPFAVEAHLAQLCTTADDGDGGGGLAGAGGDDPVRLPVALTEEAQADRAAHRHDWIAPAGRPDRTVTHGIDRRTADCRVRTTGPDATPLPLGAGRTRLGDQDHSVVAGGRARILRTALVAPAEVQENQPALALLWRARFRWKRHPQQVTADTTDGTSEQIVAIEQEQIRADSPLSAVGQHAGLFTEHDSDCQATPRRSDAAPAAVCRTCALKPQGTTASRGRRVGRRRAEPYLDRVRRDHATEADAKARRKRQGWVEPLFAEAKEGHGVRRFRLRGLAKVTGEAVVSAAGQHRKRLWGWRGWGRPCPSGAAGGGRPDLQPLSGAA